MSKEKAEQKVEKAEKAEPKAEQVEQKAEMVEPEPKALSRKPAEKVEPTAEPEERKSLAQWAQDMRLATWQVAAILRMTGCTENKVLSKSEMQQAVNAMKVRHLN